MIVYDNDKNKEKIDFHVNHLRQIKFIKRMVGAGRFSSAVDLLNLGKQRFGNFLGKSIEKSFNYVTQEENKFIRREALDALSGVIEKLTGRDEIVESLLDNKISVEEFRNTVDKAIDSAQDQLQKKPYFDSDFDYYGEITEKIVQLENLGNELRFS